MPKPQNTPPNDTPPNEDGGQEPKKGDLKILEYKGPAVHERVIRAKDFQTLVPGSELKQHVWNQKNNFRVDVREWKDAEIAALIKADSNFKLVEG